jgi:transposase
MANGLNANLLRRWLAEHRDRPQGERGVSGEDKPGSPQSVTPVPVAVSASEVEPSGAIKIEIHRQQAVFEITWPVSQATSCAQWLRELLQ